MPPKRNNVSSSMKKRDGIMIVAIIIIVVALYKKYSYIGEYFLNRYLFYSKIGENRRSYDGSYRHFFLYVIASPQAECQARVNVNANHEKKAVFENPNSGYRY